MMGFAYKTGDIVILTDSWEWGHPFEKEQYECNWVHLLPSLGVRSITCFENTDII